jgi:hypothetical protein
MADPKDIALWMVGELKRTQSQSLYQEEVVSHLHSTSGNDLTYINANGNWAIDRRVLAEFRKLTEGTVVWERGERLWRLRGEFDAPGTRQAD